MCVAAGPDCGRMTLASPAGKAAGTLLPLDDCLYALQANIPQLTRPSSLQP